MKALVRTSVELAGSSLSAEFIFDTVKSYFDAFGDAIFLGLDLRDISTLFAAFDVAKASKDERFKTIVESFLASLQRRNELLPAWLMAGSTLERANDVSPEASAMLLRIKEHLRQQRRQRRLSSEEWVLLGRSYLALNRSFNILYAGTKRASVLSHALRYANLAHNCFGRVHDEVGKDDSLRYLGVTYMHSGNYRLARKTLVPLFRREIVEAGFGPFKAASLNNLFNTYLGVGAVRLAEGFFWEASYQYAHSRPNRSLLPLLTLAVAPYAEPYSIVFKRLPELRLAVPPLEILLDKLTHAWKRIDRGDKRDSFFRVSQTLLLISARFEEVQELSRELQALTFLVRVHEECFAEPDTDSSEPQLPEKVVLKQLRAHLLRCIAGGRLDPGKIHSLLGPIRTQPMQDVLQNLAPDA
jgi:hypothetical protein